MFYYRVEVLSTPIYKVLDKWQQRLAKIRDRIIDPRRYIGIKLTVKNPVGV